jgi:hypothetical protein
MGPSVAASATSNYVTVGVGDEIFGVDVANVQKPVTLEQVATQIINFRKEQRPETLEQMAMQTFDGINLPDTAPCEMIPYLAPEEDLA